MEDSGEVELKRGGWFVVYDMKDWSDPWRSKEAAELARIGKYDEAHRLERAA